MKIGNIVYEIELINHINVEYINYINSPTEYKKIDNNLPTLYVGWLFMKKCNQYDPTFQNIDILTNEVIQNKLYWPCNKFIIKVKLNILIFLNGKIEIYYERYYLCNHFEF